MIASYENRATDFTGNYHRYDGHLLKCEAHLHHHLELMLLLHGQTVGYAGTERCQLRDGDAFLSFPNQIHRFDSVGPEEFYLFIVDPRMMPELEPAFEGSVLHSARIPGAAADPEILRLAALLTDRQAEGDQYEKVAKRGYLLALFARLLGMAKPTGAAPGDSQALKAVLSYCVKNYRSDLSLSVLEEQLHISRTYISHLFSDKLHIRFNDYINSLRVSYACHYLEGDDYSVTEIADLVGFGTTRTFDRAFQKRMGRTPSEYRRESNRPRASEIR